MIPILSSQQPCEVAEKRSLLLGFKRDLQSIKLVLLSPHIYDTNGQIIYYASVHTLKTEKTQDDFSIYMAYAYMRGKINAHI